MLAWKARVVYSRGRRGAQGSGGAREEACRARRRREGRLEGLRDNQHLCSKTPLGSIASLYASLYAPACTPRGTPAYVNSTSARRSIPYFPFLTVMMGTPGIFRMRRLSSTSFVATM